MDRVAPTDAMRRALAAAVDALALLAGATCLDGGTVSRGMAAGALALGLGGGGLHGLTLGAVIASAAIAVGLR